MRGKKAAPDAVTPDDGKHYALRLTLGGAPSTMHVIPGLGYVRTDPPAPVGGPGEPTLEQAIAAATDPGNPVELVELSERQVEQARTAMHEARLEAQRQLAHAVRVDGELPQDRIDDEAAAITGAAGEGS
jgi:hypothetical protein